MINERVEVFCVISDHLTHDSATVHTFQKHVINDVKTTVPPVSKIFYFIDRASSQYEKKIINLFHHEEDFGHQAEWHLVATSHRKNACDGVRGTTMREVTKRHLETTAEIRFYLLKKCLISVTKTFPPLSSKCRSGQPCK